MPPITKIVNFFSILAKPQPFPFSWTAIYITTINQKFVIFFHRYKKEIIT
jgi:hypothetical protein